MRNLWIENTTTKAIWNLLPEDPYKTNDGCALLSLKGMGFEQEITQSQVNDNYFISEITSSNVPVTGVMYFNGDEHLQNFQKFIGDFRKQFKLCYSPDRDIEPYDRLSFIYYKLFTISQFNKTEKDEFGWYQCSVTFIPQQNVWQRDFEYGVKNLGLVGNSLVYPYIYPYVLGGRDTFAIEIQNGGRETGCLIRIKNNSDAVLSDIEWFVEYLYTDVYGVEHTEVQRSKWYTNTSNVQLQPGYELYVDSNELSQDAKVIFTNGTSQSIVDLQEPSDQYINFVRLKNGRNRFVFYINDENVDVFVSYQEKKEII